MRLHDHEDGLGLTELCQVEVVDDPHPVNGAHHEYELWRTLLPGDVSPQSYHGSIPAITRGSREGEQAFVGFVRFQRGPRAEPDSTPGTLDGALLAILIHRLHCFQAGPFASAENNEVLTYLEAALEALKRRAKERAARGVLGRNVK
jgi:hypothetical protein